MLFIPFCIILFSAQIDRQTTPWSIKMTVYREELGRRDKGMGWGVRTDKR